MSHDNRLSVDEASTIAGITRLAVRNRVSRLRFALTPSPASLSRDEAALLLCLSWKTVDSLIVKGQLELGADGYVLFESARRYLAGREDYERVREAIDREAR